MLVAGAVAPVLVLDQRRQLAVVVRVAVLAAGRQQRQPLDRKDGATLCHEGPPAIAAEVRAAVSIKAECGGAGSSVRVAEECGGHPAAG